MGYESEQHGKQTNHVLSHQGKVLLLMTRTETLRKAPDMMDTPYLFMVQAAYANSIRECCPWSQPGTVPSGFPLS